MLAVKTALGIVIGVMNLLGLAMTLTTLYAVYHITQKPHSSPIYVMAFTILSGDVIQLLLGLFYLCPSIIADSFFFEGDRESPVVVFLGSIFLFAWYLGTISQVVVAVNRLVVLCLPKRFDFFTFRRVVYIMGSLYPISVMLSLTSQYILPCCNFSFNHNFLSYTYKPGSFNYSNAYIDLWLNFCSSAICLSSYIIIIFHVRKRNNEFKNSLNEQQRKERKAREYRYALQFLGICIFYLFSWTFFRLFPLCLPEKESANWFSIIGMTVALDSSANALVYLSTNQEVNQVLKKRLFENNLVGVTASDEEAPQSANANYTN